MTTVADALRPVRDALTRRAQHDAEQILAEAAATAAHTEDMARAEAKQLLDEAQVRGEADARILLADAKAAARRAARSTRLRAQKRVYDLLRQRVQASLHELRDAEDYAELRAAITMNALMLGPATVVREHPSGGVVARAPGRCLDYSFATLAERALERVAPDLEELWTS